jgi:hypothetical protein
VASQVHAGGVLRSRLLQQSFYGQFPSQDRDRDLGRKTEKGINDLLLIPKERVGMPDFLLSPSKTVSTALLFSNEISARQAGNVAFPAQGLGVFFFQRFYADKAHGPPRRPPNSTQTEVGWTRPPHVAAVIVRRTCVDDAALFASFSS